MGGGIGSEAERARWRGSPLEGVQGSLRPRERLRGGRCQRAPMEIRGGRRPEGWDLRRTREAVARRRPGQAPRGCSGPHGGGPPTRCAATHGRRSEGRRSLRGPGPGEALPGCPGTGGWRTTELALRCRTPTRWSSARKYRRSGKPRPRRPPGEQQPGRSSFRSSRPQRRGFRWGRHAGDPGSCVGLLRHFLAADRRVGVRHRIHQNGKLPRRSESGFGWIRHCFRTGRRPPRAATHAAPSAASILRRCTPNRGG
jgi:hypothetical protein